MKRRFFSRLARIRIFDAAEGVCCLCNMQIYIPKEKWGLEHIKPLWLGGADDESNVGPAHERCMIEKTIGEAPIKAKSDRQRANHLGIRKQSTFPCGRNSRWKKRIDGTVVPR